MVWFWFAKLIKPVNYFYQLDLKPDSQSILLRDSIKYRSNEDRNEMKKERKGRILILFFPQRFN